MRFRHTMMLLTVILYLAGPLVNAQQADVQPAQGPVIQTGTRLVLVDTVVTDKKGNYVRDLTEKDFRVWEDNKEQTVKSFSFEADPASASSSRTRYLVLFFDNSTITPSDQMRARQAAAQFISANAGQNRLMAIVNFGGSVRIAQNFTADVDRLKQVVSGVKFSAVSPNAQRSTVEVASLGMPRLGNAEAEFGARSVLLALRSMAKNLATVPGRKTLVLFTSGFPLTDENRSELTAAIDACNKANVAVYPIDVRGLVASGDMGPRTGVLGSPSPAAFGFTAARSAHSFLRLASWTPQPASFFQRPGGGGGAPGGGGTGGGMGAGGGQRGGGAGAPGGGSGAGAGGRPGGSGSTPGGGANTGGGGKGGGTAPGGGSTGKGGGTPGTGGAGGRGGAGGGGGSSRPGTMMGQPYVNNPFNQPRLIIPEFSQSATTNQQVLYALAQGTGGFMIVNTNDLLHGLEKIASEQNEYYILGYSPAETPEGSCHTLRVKVSRGGTTVRARSGYCNVRPVDLLAGSPLLKDLENRAAGSAPGTVAASMTVPFFYTSPNTARVNVAMEIPSGTIKFEKVKGKLHSVVNVLGLAYKPDGTVAARFSDTVKLDLEKKELDDFTKQPLHYENQFDVASGQYNLKVVFSSGAESFGKLELPLVIEPYDSKQFSLSGIALSKDVHPVSDVGIGLDAALLEGRTPLVFRGLQITPSGANRFKKTDMAVMYVEIYAPLLVDPNPPAVAIQLRVLDRRTGQPKEDSGFVNVAGYVRPGNPVVPVGLKLPIASLTSGPYRAELKAVDSAGNSSMLRAAEFEME